MLKNKPLESPPLSFPTAAPFMIWGLDRDGMIAWVNPGREPDRAWMPADLVGRSIFEVLQDYPALLDQVSLALSGINTAGVIQREDRSWTCQLFPIQTSEEAPDQTLCLFSENSLQGRLWIEEALTGTAAALQKAQGYEDMPPLITRQLQELLGVERTAFALGAPPDTPYQLLFSWGDWESPLPERGTLTGTLVDPHIIENLNGRCCNLQELAGVEKELSPIYGAALAVGGQGLGALWLGRETPLTSLECQLVHKLAEMSARALQRARQHELTSRRLERISALHAIERAITGSLNLDLTLQLILEQVVSQLKVDAADIILTDPERASISFAAGLGFERYQPQAGISKARETLIQDALRKKDLVVLQDLAEDQPGLQRRGIFGLEGFRSYHAVPLIAKRRVMGALEVYHRTPPQVDGEWYEFLRTLGSQAAVAMDNAALVEDLRRTNLELDQAYNTTLEGWVRALDLRDPCTGGHTQRVVERTLKLADAVGLPRDQLVHVRRGALLHDIGKLGVPDSILNKAGPLTDAEWAVMRKHPLYAREMLQPIEFLHPALPIPTAHHEKWDGSGYPDGLQGSMIPLAARIFAVIDVWDALSSPRPYRDAWPEEQIHGYIREQAGGHFDPQIVAAWERAFAIPRG